MTTYFMPFGSQLQKEKNVLYSVNELRKMQGIAKMEFLYKKLQKRQKELH